MSKRKSVTLRSRKEVVLIAAPTHSEADTAEISAGARPHLAYLDGLRGTAALYVVFYHAWGEMAWSWDGRGLSHSSTKATQWLEYGVYSVVVFIVLSGYCLMLPVARSQSERALIFSGYIKRRARRILPPYYAALACSLLLIAVVPGLQRPACMRWDSALPAFTPGAIVSHLFLLHNLSPQWIYKINNPMWSVATEWQIYFVFPALLLPIWKRWGKGASVAGMFALGLAAHFLSHRQLTPAHPWYLGIFALGTAAADISFSQSPRETHWREYLPWGWVVAMLIAVLLILYTLAPGIARYGIAMDAIAGTATACALVFCTRATQLDSSRKSIFLRLLETKCVAALGRFSYSLYLTHFLVLGMLHLMLLKLKLTADASLAALILAGVPLSLLFAWGFYLLFEKPFQQTTTLSSLRRQAKVN